MENFGNNPVIKEIIQEKNGNDLFTSIKLDRKIWEPFSPGSICDITNNYKRICNLHHFINYENNVYNFITYDYNILDDFNIKKNVYVYGQWFTPEQLEYAQKNIEEWEFEKYKVKNDHEHCITCWETISEYSHTKNYGYKIKNENVWMCEICFDKYIKSKFGMKLGP